MKKKSTVLTNVVFILLTALFDIISFWFIKEFTSSFWISICFGNASILLFFLATISVCKKSKYTYLNFQNGMIVSSYYIVCTVMNICFILFKMQNVSVNLFVNILLLIVCLIVLLIFLVANADTLARLECDKSERNAFYNLKDRAEQLLDKSNDRQVNKKIELLYDRICSCQINLTTEVSVVDEKIMVSLNELSAMLDLNNSSEIQGKIASTLDMIEERDKIIKNTIKR